jgi:hypothetical protein
MAKFELCASAARSFDDKTLQQARFQTSSNIDLSRRGKDCVRAPTIFILDCNSMSTHSCAYVLRD